MINLTKEEYQANRSSSPACRALAERGLRRNPDSAGEMDYAQCVLREDGFCSLLTKDMLCAWWDLRGESVGAVCNDFPNMHCLFLEDEYVSPTVACEAIAELLLKKADPIQLVGESALRPNRSFAIKIDAASIERRPLLGLYPDLTRWGLSLLQDRRFSLDDRFVLLANAMRLIDWMEQSGRVENLRPAMAKFLDDKNIVRIVHSCEGLSVGPKAFLAVNASAFSRLVDDARYGAIARRVLGRLGVEILESGKDGHARIGQKPVDSETYRKRKRDLAGFMREKEVFLEHLLVCEYLRSMTPLAEPCVWANFLVLNVCYALHKGIIYGSFDAPPGETDLVDALVLVHRMFIHNWELHNNTLERLSAIRLTDLDAMVALAKG